MNYSDLPLSVRLANSRDDHDARMRGEFVPPRQSAWPDLPRDRYGRVEVFTDKAHTTYADWFETLPTKDDLDQRSRTRFQEQDDPSKDREKAEWLAVERHVPDDQREVFIADYVTRAAARRNGGLPSCGGVGA